MAEFSVDKVFHLTDLCLQQECFWDAFLWGKYSINVVFYIHRATATTS